MRKQKVLVLVGDALLLGWVAEALAEALLAVAEAEDALELEWLAEGETRGEVAEADTLALADVLRETSVTDVVAAGEMETVDAPVLAGALEPEPTTEAPAGELPSPVWVPPKSRNATTAMPAKPPVSMSPIPRNLCESCSARDLPRDPPAAAALDAALGAVFDAVLACGASEAVFA
jgi:hypothetical protein